jgi:hypothetical protein
VRRVDRVAAGYAVEPTLVSPEILVSLGRQGRMDGCARDRAPPIIGEWPGYPLLARRGEACAENLPLQTKTVAGARSSWRQRPDGRRLAWAASISASTSPHAFLSCHDGRVIGTGRSRTREGRANTVANV